MSKLEAEQERVVSVIREFYEDPQTTGNAKALYRAIKKRGIRGITQQTIQDWLNNLDFKQRNKKYQMSGYYIPVKPRQEYQLDVMYFIEPNSDLKQYKRFDGVAPKTFARNKGLKYGLVCVDIFTKYADVEPMRRKTAKETTEAVLRIFQRMGKPETVYTDGGSEFRGEFLQKMIELNIKPIMTMTHASFAEVFIKTFKNKLYPYMARVGTKTYYNIVDKIVSNYNNTDQSVIKMTPVEATDPKNEEEVRMNIHDAYLKKNHRLVRREALEEGDKVRHLIKRDGFAKDYEPSYSKDVSTVTSINRTWPYVYVRLSNGKDFLPNEVLKVAPPSKTEKARNKFAEGTLEQRTRELGQAERVDDGTKERLQAQNREELKVKQELRRTRRKQKPKRFLEGGRASDLRFVSHLW